VEVAEKISVNGWCEEVVRRVRVDEVATRRKLVQIKIDYDSGGDVMVDEDDDVVVGGDLVLVVEVVRD
jgi:hypothetical protein